MARGRNVSVVVLLLCAGCNFRVPSPTYISDTKLIAVTAEVAQLGPLNPDRVGVPFASPIAEPMPGDRFAFTGVIVDADGEPLGPDEVESIWFQCGIDDCGAFGWPLDGPAFDVPCDESEISTLDATCRLGEGDVRFEFEVAELGPLIVDIRVANFYGVFAWDGRSAEDCWSARRSGDTTLEHCAYIQRQVKIGPSWWMLAYAETLGLTSSIPVYQIPIAVYAQQANRVPSAYVDVTIDGEYAGTYPETTQFAARLGDSIHIEIRYDELEQLLQSYFFALFDQTTQSYWFQVAQEFMTDTVYTTETIHVVGENEFPVERDFVVDEYGDPGSAQMYIRYTDDRYGEGVARLDFEVER